MLVGDFQIKYVGLKLCGLYRISACPWLNGNLAENGPVSPQEPQLKDNKEDGGLSLTSSQLQLPPAESPSTLKP